MNIENIKYDVPSSSTSSLSTAEHIEHTICWKSAFAGLFVGALTFVGVSALFLALGGSGLSDGTSGTNAGIFTGISFLLAIIVSTLVGSYFAVRLHRHNNKKNAYTQSLLVSSLIILVVLFELAMGVSMLGKAAGTAVGATLTAVGASTIAAGQNPMVQDLVEDSLGELSLKSSPEVVLRGVTSRLINGNEEGAKNYLAAQAGLTPTQADQRIASAKNRIDSATTAVREATATAMKATGWSVFLMIVLGVLSSLLGGFLALKSNTGRSNFG
jgi:hypothetical protein